MSSVKSIPMGKGKIKGVYLFSDGDKHLYVGRSKDIRQRHKQHFALSSRLHDAPFAVLLARECTGIQAGYSGEYVRNKLEKNEMFMSAFSKAKERIARMDFRFIEETDPIKQTLLEIYCAVVFATPYNKFDVS